MFVSIAEPPQTGSSQHGPEVASSAPQITQGNTAVHKQFNSFTTTGTLVLGWAMLVVSGGDAAQAADAAAEPVSCLEEVVVSARRREESLQDVPVAVSAVSGETLERAFITDTTQLAQFAPNVVLDKVEAGTAGGAAFSIRGISYQDVEKAFDPTVLVFVDDVALGTGTGNVMSLLDVERVEILRGPQGTLFGKNAVGGIINIHRRKPVLDNMGARFAQRWATSARRTSRDISISAEKPRHSS